MSTGSSEGSGLYLLVIQANSSSIFRLPEEGAVVIGRAPEVDLRIEDGSVSRRHARLFIGSGGCRIVDLDSHNGTTVEGERLTAARPVAPGDTIMVGEVTLMLRTSSRPSTACKPIELVELHQRLEVESERAALYGRPVALIVLSGVERPATARLMDALRAMDVAAWSGAAVLIVAAPEIGEAAAVAVAERLIETGGNRHARAGVACLPEDGCDAATLLAAARGAVEAAAPGAVKLAGRTANEIDLGEGRVLVADAVMVRLYALLKRLGASDLAVLVSGETGSGKEHVAHALHHFSSRRAGPFVPINCAAIQDALIESELFGHEKGAFSGAATAKAGRLELARGGTVLLDEVGELSPSAQAKLLRALETRRITRVGGVTEREIDLRLVAATHRDLELEVSAGRFRRDLYFRLAAATVVVPPLRDRPREIVLLARRFLDEACIRAGRPEIVITPAAQRRMSRHGWPGNVRELKNLMDYGAAVAEEELDEWHLPEGLGGDAPAHGDSPLGGDAAPVVVAHPMSPLPTPSRGVQLADELREVERQRIEEALTAAGGIQTRAAERLGMPIRTLSYKMKRYGIVARRGG